MLRFKKTKAIWRHAMKIVHAMAGASEFDERAQTVRWLAALEDRVEALESNPHPCCVLDNSEQRHVD